MYETEVNRRVESPDQLPDEIVARFSELSDKIVRRTALPWGEHCTECVWPTCYKTCELYAPREDKKCQRFVNGMVRIPHPTSLNSYILKISFKRWAKLWTAANIHLYPTAEAKTLENRDHRIGRALQLIPLPALMRGVVTRKRYDRKKKWAIGKAPSEELPDAFVVESFNPTAAAVRLTLKMQSFDEASRTPFQQLIELAPGFNRVFIPFPMIVKVLNPRAPFHIELTPNETEEVITLYFGTVDFIKQRVPARATASQNVTNLKCVVWDLDNTLWEGILAEDGPDKLRMKPGVREVIEQLDQRGILHSVASKNNPEEALRVLKAFGVDEYFLYPQISWEPKSRGIKAIAENLNISLEAIAFIDDSEFELSEVRSNCPEVRTLNANAYLSLPELEQCQVPITNESRLRRKMYQADQVRRSLGAEFRDDYLSFLRSCEMQMEIDSLTFDNLERVHELTQRTNQMNFSGTRYDRSTLFEILKSEYLDSYVLACHDRFGSYGIVGFSIVDKREPRMTDLVFSCRVQSKRVEHAFLTYVLKKYRDETASDMWVNYRKTPRNAASGRVFENMQFEFAGEENGVTSLVFRKHRDIPDDKLLKIRVLERAGLRGALASD